MLNFLTEHGDFLAIAPGSDPTSAHASIVDMENLACHAQFVRNKSMLGILYGQEQIGLAFIWSNRYIDSRDPRIGKG